MHLWVEVEPDTFVNLGAAMDVRLDPYAAAKHGHELAVAVLLHPVEGGKLYYDDAARAILAALRQITRPDIRPQSLFKGDPYMTVPERGER